MNSLKAMNFKGINHVLVKLDSLYNDQFTTEGGLTLFKAGSRGTQEKFHYAHEDKITGEVVGLPQRGGNKLLNSNEKPVPPRASYRSGERVARLPEIYRSRDRYICSTYEDEAVTTKGNVVDIEVGDTVYFQRTSLNDESILSRGLDGSILVMIDYPSLILRIRNEEMKMLNMYVMSEQFYEDDVQDFDIEGRSIKGKELVYGSLKLILPTTGRKIQYGRIVCTGEGIPQMPMPNVSVGDVVIYSPVAEQEHEIEGKRRFVFWATDFMAKIVGNEVIPLGNYVTVKPKYPEIKSSLYIPQTVLDNIKPDRGTVTGVGEFVEDILIGDDIQYVDYSSFDGMSEFLVKKDQILLRYE